MRTFTLLSVLGIGLCTAPVIQAQTSESPWTFGVKAGVNLSTFNVGDSPTSTSSNTDGRIGLNGGITVEYALRNNFFLSSGLEFTTKGADYSKSYGPNQLNSNYKSIQESRTLEYLQLPLTVGYRLPVSKNVNVTFNAGAYFALGVSGKGTSVIWEHNLDEDGKMTSTFNRNKSNKKGDTDYGLIGGAGLEYKKFSLNFNYELGLRSLYTGSSSHDVNDAAWKNRNVVLSVGYKF